MISIVVNGKNVELDRPMTVTDYLNQIGFQGRRVAVAVNSEVLQADEYEATEINDGDRVEVVRPVGGG
ncbi:MAG: sulfur carrier protein ThiS [Chloroflexi bacterium]|nr:sulfur carrier protein ThiS [Chloroflexota bacterium]